MTTQNTFRAAKAVFLSLALVLVPARLHAAELAAELTLGEKAYCVTVSAAVTVIFGPGQGAASLSACLEAEALD